MSRATKPVLLLHDFDVDMSDSLKALMLHQVRRATHEHRGGSDPHVLSCVLLLLWLLWLLLLASLSWWHQFGEGSKPIFFTPHSDTYVVCCASPREM